MINNSVWKRDAVRHSEMEAQSIIQRCFPQPLLLRLNRQQLVSVISEKEWNTNIYYRWTEVSWLWKTTVNQQVKTLKAGTKEGICKVVRNWSFTCSICWFESDLGFSWAFYIKWHILFCSVKLMYFVLSFIIIWDLLNINLFLVQYWQQLFRVKMPSNCFQWYIIIFLFGLQSHHLWYIFQLDYFETSFLHLLQQDQICLAI